MYVIIHNFSSICTADLMVVQYNLTSPSWVDFIPAPGTGVSPHNVVHYGESRRLTPPPLATPAILSFLTLISLLSPYTAGLGGVHIPLVSPVVVAHDSSEWECEWERCCNLGQANFGNVLTNSFRPGSIDGLWEGIFTVKRNFLSSTSELC
jgi:hypothetical protein